MRTDTPVAGGSAPRFFLGHRLSTRSAEAVALGVVLLLAISLRFYAIGDIPPGVWFDEGANVIDARAILAGERPIFLEGNQGREPLYIYLTALSLRLFGETPLALRLPPAAFGMATVVAVWLLARELFGRRVALLTALATSTTLWPLIMSRLSLRAVSLPFFEALAAWLLLRAIRTRSLPLYALAGAVTGLSLYTYISSRVFPLVLAAIGIGFFLPDWRGNLTWRRHFTGMVLLVVTAAIVFLPLGGYFWSHPKQFFGRAETSSLAAPNVGPAVPAEALIRVDPSSLADNALKTIGMLAVAGDVNARHNLPGRPVFDPLAAALAGIGLAVLLARLRRPASALLLLWLPITLLPAVLASEAPHHLRTIGALPAILLLPALGADACWRAAARMDRPGWRLAARCAVVAAIAVSVLLNARDFLVVWANDPRTYRAFQGDVRDAERLGLSFADEGKVVVPTTLYRGESALTPVYGNDKRVARMYGGSGLIVAPPDDGRPLFYAYAENVVPLNNLLCRYLECGDVVVRQTGVDGQADVTVYRVAPGFAARLRPPTPLVARFGDRFRLAGFALPRVARPGERIVAAVYGEVNGPPPDDGDWKLFANLVPAGGGGNLAGDYVSFDAKGLKPGDTFVAWFELQTLPDSPAGLYDLHFGLFESHSLQRAPVFDGQERRIGDVVVLGRTRLAEQPAATVAPAQATGYTLGGEIALDGYRVASEGAKLRVALDWRAVAAPTSDYTAFVHVVDASGKLVAQHDGPPAGGQLPTRNWWPGEVVHDEHEVTLPAGASPRDVRLLVGMYRQDNGERLTVSGPAGNVSERVVPLER